MTTNVKTFNLTHTIADFNTFEDLWTEEESHFNIPWQLHIRKKHGEKNGLRASLYCRKPKGSNLWSIRTSSRFTVKSGTFESTEQTHTDSFNEEDVTSSRETYFDTETVHKLNTDGNVMVIFEIKVLAIIGIRQKRLVDFDGPFDMLKDVVLVVEDKKFHVSKVMLSHSSPVFLTMFSSGFQESKHHSEVVIEDVAASDFETFLQCIYSCEPVIDENNVEALLKLADRYEVDAVAARCETFLISADVMDKKDKLRLADQYVLSDLQKECLDGLKSAKDVKDLNLKAQNLGESTAKALYAKLLKFS